MAIDENIKLTIDLNSNNVCNVCLGCVHKEVCQFKNEYFDVASKIMRVIRDSDESTGDAIFSISQITCKFFNKIVKEENYETINLALQHQNIINELVKRDLLGDSITSTCSLGNSLKRW